MAFDPQRIRGVVKDALQGPSRAKIKGTEQTAPGKPPEIKVESVSAPDDVPADIHTILASTEKLLHVNRGLAEPDERDSLEFRRIYTPDRLFADRVDMDADKVLRQTMRRVAKMRSLKPVGVAHFDPYTEGLIVSHPLSSPLEEINPLSLTEQARRITGMGPGGIPSTDSISEEAQALHPSHFGFISGFEGPESEKAGIDVRASYGTRYGEDGKIYQRFFNRRLGRHQWLSASDVAHLTIGIPE